MTDFVNKCRTFGPPPAALLPRRTQKVCQGHSAECDHRLDARSRRRFFPSANSRSHAAARQSFSAASRMSVEPFSMEAHIFSRITSVGCSFIGQVSRSRQASRSTPQVAHGLLGAVRWTRPRRSHASTPTAGDVPDLPGSVVPLIGRRASDTDHSIACRVVCMASLIESAHHIAEAGSNRKRGHHFAKESPFSLSIHGVIPRPAGPHFR